MSDAVLREAELKLTVISTLLIGFFLVSAIPSLNAVSEEEQVQWQQFLPGISGSSVVQTTDGGYLALGVNASIQENDLGENVFANQEPILVKTDASGNIVWTKTYHAEGGRLALSKVIQTNDGGYALGGVYVVSNVFLNQENKLSLIKVDSRGEVEWSKLLKGYDNSFPEAVGPSFATLVQTSDQGYALASSFFYNVYFQEIWFVKTDSFGNLQLNKTIDAGGGLLSIATASDGGYVIFSEILGRGGGSQFCATKIDSDGNTLWMKTYMQQDSVSSYATCGIATSDGGNVLGGYSIFEEDVAWVVKTDEQGEILWNKSYSYNNYSSSVESISQADDGGFILLGKSVTTPRVFDLSSRFFTWIARIDSSGNLRGEIGIEMGNHFTRPTSIIQVEDGGFAFVGTWNESFWATSDQRFWFVKIASTLPSIPMPSAMPTPYEEPQQTSQSEMIIGSAITVTVITAGLGLLIYHMRRR